MIAAIPAEPIEGGIVRRTFDTCVLRAMLVYVTFVTVATGPAWSQGRPNFHNRLVLMVEEGETIQFVPPALPTGSSAPISLVNVGPVGSYLTALNSGTLEPVFLNLVTNGHATAGPFTGAFSLPTGEIADEHTAWFTISPEPPRLAQHFPNLPAGVGVLVIVVTAEGTITGGSGQYHDASGVTKIYLKVEVPADFSAFPLARTAQFVFEFDQ